MDSSAMGEFFLGPALCLAKDSNALGEWLGGRRWDREATLRHPEMLLGAANLLNKL